MKDLRDDILLDKILSPLIRCWPKYLIRLILVDALSLLVDLCASLFPDRSSDWAPKDLAFDFLFQTSASIGTRGGISKVDVNTQEPAGTV